jgi:twitching motility protein PilT
MQIGKALGMITMDDSLKDLYAAGLVTAEDALFRAIDQEQMRKDLKL